MATDPSSVPLPSVEDLENAERSEDTYNESPPSDIVAYNELRSCADLFRMADEGNLIIQPEFQRDFIWKSTDQTRFIDSLVKQLPVPSMCFAFDHRQNIWIVIDGLQRISTINKFLRGDDWKLAALDDVDSSLRNKNAATLKNAKSGDNKVLFSRVQNQTLPVNIIRCDLTKRSHNEYIFTIFHRLNSGGLKLNNQEIRNCIYSGPLNDLIRKLDKVASWRRINNMRNDDNYRFAKQESILRFFAFFESRSSYKGSISKFLNDFMHENRNCSDTDVASREILFTEVCAIISDSILVNNPVPRLPSTVLEAVMIGIATNLPHVRNMNAQRRIDLFGELRAHSSLSAEYLSEGLSKPDRVEERLNAAQAIFAK